MTHAILRNLTPFNAPMDPEAWSVFKIFTPFVYAENASRIHPNKSEIYIYI